MSFTGKVAVLTGASSGIGRSIAESLAQTGASLCLTGRKIGLLKEIIEDMQTSLPFAAAYESDLLIDEHIYSLRDRIHDDLGHVDILIHCAGAFSMGSFENSKIEDFDALYKINVRAPFLLTKVLLPMIKDRKGQVVFINSTAGHSAGKNVSQYAATKHALKAIADSLRAEVNESGVRVLSIYPGRTATPMQENIHNMENRRYNPQKLMQPADVANAVINALALPRSAEITDINIRPMMKPE